MTVAEVIQALQTFPADMTCVVNCGKNELANGWSVGKVEVIDAWKFDIDSTRFIVDHFPEHDDGDPKCRVVNITA